MPYLFQNYYKIIKKRFSIDNTIAFLEYEYFVTEVEYEDILTASLKTIEEGYFINSFEIQHLDLLHTCKRNAPFLLWYPYSKDYIMF